MKRDEGVWSEILTSRILGPLDAETERGFVLLVHMELDALAAVPVPGTFLVRTCAVLFDATHTPVISVK